LVLVKGLDNIDNNNTCAAFGKTRHPFSKVNSPESPKHREEKVKGRVRRREKKEASKEGGNEERCFKMSLVHIVIF